MHFARKKQKNNPTPSDGAELKKKRLFFWRPPSLFYLVPKSPELFGNSTGSLEEGASPAVPLNSSDNTLLAREKGTIANNPR